MIFVILCFYLTYETNQPLYFMMFDLFVCQICYIFLLFDRYYSCMKHTVSSLFGLPFFFSYFLSLVLIVLFPLSHKHHVGHHIGSQQRTSTLLDFCNLIYFLLFLFSSLISLSTDLLHIIFCIPRFLVPLYFIFLVIFSINWTLIYLWYYLKYLGPIYVKISILI